MIGTIRTSEEILFVRNEMETAKRMTMPRPAVVIRLTMDFIREYTGWPEEGEGESRDMWTGECRKMKLATDEFDTMDEAWDDLAGSILRKLDESDRKGNLEALLEGRGIATYRLGGWPDSAAGTFTVPEMTLT